jgi:hypothetical protein
VSVAGQTIEVVTQQVDAAAARVSRVPGEVTGGLGALQGAADAAADTPAAAACEHAANQVAAMLPKLSSAAADMSRALAAAAECYRAADRLPTEG